MIRNKKCENRCPACNSENIDWGDTDICETETFQEGSCEECGCDFKEYSAYKETEWDDPEHPFETAIDFINMEDCDGSETSLFKFKTKAENYLKQQVEEYIKLSKARGEEPDVQKYNNVTILKSPTMEIHFGVYTKIIQA
ncbi:MAG: hypothetical protein J7L15_08405 [Clostridiales bacterium]|nr:hypothetical protein [Clostridiales bacterium]